MAKFVLSSIPALAGSGAADEFAIDQFSPLIQVFGLAGDDMYIAYVANLVAVEEAGGVSTMTSTPMTLPSFDVICANRR